MKFQVLISTASFGADPSLLPELRQQGIVCTLNPYKRTLAEDEVRVLLANKDGLIAGTERLTASVLEAARRLRVISRVGIGLDNIDLEAAERRGIRVFNTPAAAVDAVAEVTLGGILALLRRLPEMDRELHGGRWTRRMGALLKGRRVGVVGIGRIGQRVVELLRAFGASVVAADPQADREWTSARGVPLLELSELLRVSEIVTLHAAAQPGGRPILGAAELAQLPLGAYVVNVARGSLIDEDALAELIRSGRIGGAYLDTFQREPYSGPLTELSDVLLTPHAAAYTAETRARMEREAAHALIEYLMATEQSR